MDLQPFLSGLVGGNTAFFLLLSLVPLINQTKWLQI